MKVSDYIVSFLIDNNISHIFGYPGGMVSYLIDSLSKYEKISAHVNYNEQGSAIAACGYAQLRLTPGIAYATSGPGVTNLLTGIAISYFDSIPTIFLTGQVNTYESKGDLPVRQVGFQEMDVISLVSKLTKYCAYIDNPSDIKYHLEKAFYYAVQGRPGPVVLDIPMDIQRADVEPCCLAGFDLTSQKSNKDDASFVVDEILRGLNESKRPCIIIGSGMQSSGMRDYFLQWINAVKIPVVSSMLAIDAIPTSTYYYGFIGAYGFRYSNFIVAKSDLIISLGSRMDIRQIGADVSKFAPNARLIRIDIDANEFTRKIKKDEKCYVSNLKELVPILSSSISEIGNYDLWIRTCDEIKSMLLDIDEQPANIFVRELSKLIEDDAVITTDVGQNQVWVAQSFKVTGQRVLFTGGHGAMGYSLPAAIGAHYGSGKKVFAFIGDGGLQMNIQELQFLVRENIPVKIILMNNESLGMIRHFQEMYFDSNYVQTKREGGYTTPDFSRIAEAYKIPYCKVSDVSKLIECKFLLDNDSPAFVEIVLDNNTYIYPKLAMGKLNQDQDPELDRKIYNYIESL